MIRRSEIYWLQLAADTGSEQSGRRPVLIIQNDVGNRAISTTIVAAIASQPRHQTYPFHVQFTPGESGLRSDGTVLCEQVHTVSQSRLGPLAGVLTKEKMQEVDLALHRSLGLER